MSKETVPGYSLLRLLGRGGMGAVYLALRTEDNRQVALKVARTSLGEHGLARLRREAELLSRLQCPYLPSFVEAREVGEQFLLAMDFVRGDPLQIYVVEDVPAEERLEMLRRALPGIAHGLLALHQVGIVHRDLKPANVIINPRRSVLVDLGLARGPDVMTLTKTGVSVGTPEYLPPEQISGELAGPPADLYQVGLIARDLLLGSRRTPGQDLIQEAMRRAISRPEDLRATAPWIPPELAEWIRASLHPTPAGRPDTSEHLQRLIHLCKQPLLPAAEAQGTAAMTWLGSPAHEQVVAARKQAEAKGWPEGQDAPAVPSWAAGEPKAAVAPAPGGKAAAAPVSAPAAPAPAPARSTWVLAALGVVLGLGVGLGFGERTSQPVASAGAKQEIVLSREGDRLVLLEGPEDLRLVEPVEADFERDESGRRSITATENVVRLSSQLDEWRVQFPEADSLLEGLIEIEGRRAITLAYLQGEARFRLHRPDTGERWETSIARELTPPGSILDGSSLVLTTQVGSGVWLEEVVDMHSFLKRLDRALGSPPGAKWNPTTGHFEPTQEAQFWFEERAPQLAALMSSPQLASDRLEERYLEMSAHVQMEWMFRTSPFAWPWPANRSLGSALRVTSYRGLPAMSDRNTNIVVRGGRLDQRIGRSVLQGSLAETNAPAGQVMRTEVRPEGGIRCTLGEFPIRVPEEAEIALYLSGMEGFTRVRVDLGGRTLLLPAGEKACWRVSQIPATWFRDALNQTGEVTVGLSVDDSKGMETALEARVQTVIVRATYPMIVGVPDQKEPSH